MILILKYFISHFLMEMFLALLPMVYIFHCLFVLRGSDFNNRNQFLTAKLLKQAYRYHRIRKTFSNVYHRHTELIVKYNIGLKTLLQQGISEPVLNGDILGDNSKELLEPI